MDKPCSNHKHPYMTTEKTIALTRQTFVGKVMSLLFNMLSRLVITFLPRNKHLLISWLQSPSGIILGPQKNKVSHCFHCFLIYFPWSDGTRCHDLSFLNVESSGRVWLWELDCEEMSAEKLMLLSCGVGEDSWESLGLQGNATSPS